MGDVIDAPIHLAAVAAVVAWLVWAIQRARYTHQIANLKSANETLKETSEARLGMMHAQVEQAARERDAYRDQLTTTAPAQAEGVERRLAEIESRFETETGDNANGSYERRGDGTQTCRGWLIYHPDSLDQRASFPASFAEAPEVYIQPARRVEVLQVSDRDFTFALAPSVSAGLRTFELEYRAHGRWR